MSQHAVSSYLEAEVKCLHCGHTSGLLRRDQQVPGAVATFQRAEGGAPVAVKGLTQLRCTRCQGSVYTDEFEVRYVYPKVDFLDEAPRRGRPPKRLIELRRAKEEALRSA